MGLRGNALLRGRDPQPLGGDPIITRFQKLSRDTRMSHSGHLHRSLSAPKKMLHSGEIIHQHVKMTSASGQLSDGHQINQQSTYDDDDDDDDDVLMGTYELNCEITLV